MTRDVVQLADDALHICNPIHHHLLFHPTQVATTLFLIVLVSSTSRPVFNLVTLGKNMMVLLLLQVSLGQQLGFVLEMSQGWGLFCFWSSRVQAVRSKRSAQPK
jgi:hypothetical protein